eukprot:Phypoly_transcript_13376.p1 GENE.Phypoly_transcript_13376~~Phypoly_transcript_13376.p1  ORF type:complete len:281 (+),score=73.43 Phypoly_transcript_13376:158-1000(+)
MVDALLIAAQSEDSEYFEDKEDDVPQLIQPRTHTHHSQPQLRICEFCGSSNTPTWRRGPGGKGSLCNACGIKWRLRKRTKKGDTTDKVKSTKTPSAKRKKRDTNQDQPDHMTTIRNPIVFKENNIHNLPQHHHHQEYMTNQVTPLSPNSLDSRKNYFCKFCNKTWDFNHFKNSQQFGAHCSNCSRRPTNPHDAMVPPSPSPSPYLSDQLSSSPTFASPVPGLSSPSLSISTPPKRFPPPPFEDPGLNLILMLRYMQEEADLSDGETLAPPSPSTLSTPVL